MGKIKEDFKETDNLLLNRFNSKDSDAFTTIYSMYFNELCRYANRIFINTNHEGYDVVQDIFISMWSKKEIYFKSLSDIKAYIYISIKNRFKDFLCKNDSIYKYKDFVLHNDDYFISQMVENEVISVISIMSEILPSDCAKIFTLYMDGWDMNDIISEMNMSKSTVYLKKQKAIDIIKRKLPNLYIFLFALK